MMQKPLVNPLKIENNPELEKLVRFFNETLGFCPNSVLTMYHRPEVAKSFIRLNKAVMENHGRVTSGLKRLIGYVCSYAAGCQYCQAHTIRAAQRYGEPDEKLQNVWEYKSHPAFNEAERAALDFALAAAQIPNRIDEQTNSNLKAHWNEGEIVEILGVVSLFGYLNRWNDSMGTSLEEDAVQSGEKYLRKKGWDGGKHV